MRAKRHDRAEAGTPSLEQNRPVCRSPPWLGALFLPESHPALSLDGQDQRHPDSGL